jgi:hypothetical protein
VRAGGAPDPPEERGRREIEEPILLANAYERVMPGTGYVDSILAFRRTFAGIDEESARRVRAFLSTFIDVDSHPLWQLGDTVSSELGKLLENSYRSQNIAFIHEWTHSGREGCASCTRSRPSCGDLGRATAHRGAPESQNSARRGERRCSRGPARRLRVRRLRVRSTSAATPTRVRR